MKLIRAIASWLFHTSKGNFRPSGDVPQPNDEEREIIDRFHDLYYRAWKDGRQTIDLSWFGYRTLKCPMDLWTYQEIICETKPDVIIECGTRHGGSALYLASLCQLAGRGRVVTVDINHQNDRPRHALITYILGSSTDAATVSKVTEEIASARRVMVILDSDHSEQHVSRELEIYAELVTKGSYLIVEDTNVNGHPTCPDFGPGPMEAVRAFIAKRQDYQIDLARERFLMTLNPSGFLKRLR